MSRDPIQGQGQSHRRLKCAKTADSKGYLLCQYARNQMRNGELWYSKTIYLIVGYSSSFGVTWPSNLRCSNFAKRIFASYEESTTGSPVRRLFIWHFFFVIAPRSSKMHKPYTINIPSVCLSLTTLNFIKWHLSIILSLSHSANWAI